MFLSQQSFTREFKRGNSDEQFEVQYLLPAYSSTFVVLVNSPSHQSESPPQYIVHLDQVNLMSWFPTTFDVEEVLGLTDRVVLLVSKTQRKISLLNVEKG